MVSDSELILRLREFLKTSDLNTTTNAIVRRKLEEDFGIDLSDKKAFIRSQVDIFIHSQVENFDESEQQQQLETQQGEQKVKSEQGSESSSEQVVVSQEEEVSSNNAKRRKKRVSNNKNKDIKRKGNGGGFNKVCSLSPELQQLLGVPELARTEVVKQLWAYIRENDLQDPSNRKNIKCDEPLRLLFRVDIINMFQMNKALSRHIWPLDSENGISSYLCTLLNTTQEFTSTANEKQRNKEKPEATVTSAPKEKRKQERHEDDDESQVKEKRQRRAGLGFLAPLPLSDALAKFIGTGESILPRSTVVKRIWDYIKANDLQDPNDKKMVLCDDKLKELFEVDSFTGFTVPKLLKTHFIKTER
ncbi:hypothetical protein IFM89_032089 [Coptis chinensis]|uniref:Upstream activation factor subunit UAF30 n=1 Tax=Coptis chinensis TaxID=261450 RepID=A0A835I2I2_9MAGN|nr:hypothetical protein IFM89_032089 [Coptis chinensis]